MMSAMTDPQLYYDRLKNPSNGKAPGPDGIPNEVLKHSPALVHEAMQAYFTAIWVSGKTPWEISDTVLLYKKDDPMDPANYRPIGLANTSYKLYTSMLTEVLSKTAEQHGLVSSCQEGFRKYRNTVRQLVMATNVLEDAKLSEQTVYALWIDFSSAFNTVDHDKLLNN
jgi:hypothetical protein